MPPVRRQPAGPARCGRCGAEPLCLAGGRWVEEGRGSEIANPGGIYALPAPAVEAACSSPPGRHIGAAVPAAHAFHVSSWPAKKCGWPPGSHQVQRHLRHRCDRSARRRRRQRAARNALIKILRHIHFGAAKHGANAHPLTLQRGRGLKRLKQSVPLRAFACMHQQEADEGIEGRSAAPLSRATCMARAAYYDSIPELLCCRRPPPAAMQIAATWALCQSQTCSSYFCPISVFVARWKQW